MTQLDERRQRQMDKAMAKKHLTPWVKHTINLRKGSELDMKFQISPNKSHMVRHVFQRVSELSREVEMLRVDNQKLLSNIAKLQTVITESYTLHPNQTTFEVIRGEEE